MSYEQSVDADMKEVYEKLIGRKVETEGLYELLAIDFKRNPRGVLFFIRRFDEEKDPINRYSLAHAICLGANYVPARKCVLEWLPGVDMSDDESLKLPPANTFEEVERTLPSPG